MAENNKPQSDTISQQRKAREEFLRLKRMQSGVIDTPPENANSIEPKTFKEKSQNFWFYNKLTVFGAIFLAVVLIVGIAQCSAREDYDINIVLYTSTQVADKSTEKMATYFKKFGEDINGDGEVKIRVINCSYTEGGNKQIVQANDTKLQAILVSETDMMLFIVDDNTLARLKSIPATTPLFTDDGVRLGEEFYESTKSEAGTKAPEGLAVIRRNITETTMQNNKTAKRAYKAAGSFLEKLKAGQ